MKIILVNRYFYPDESATSRLFTSLGEALAKQGHTVHVVASSLLHDNPAHELPAHERTRGLVIHRVRSTRFGRGRLSGRALDYVSFHLSSFVTLLRLLRRDDICIVGTDPPLLSVTAVLACSLKGAALVNWVFDLFPEVATNLGVIKGKSPLAWLCRVLRNLSFRQARLNAVPMAAMGKVLSEAGVPPSRTAVIASWSDGEAIRPIPAQDCALRREWGLGGKFVVGYSGNLGRAHDFTTILDAAWRLRDRSDIIFLFVGGGYWRGFVEEEALRRGLKNIIMKPLQPRERLGEALSIPDVHLVSLLPVMEPFVVPSKFYGIAAAGRPTLFVGDPEGEIAHLVTRHSCGAAIPIGDATALEKWILELKENSELRLAMGANARALFERGYTEPRGVAEWSALLGTVAVPPQDELPLAPSSRLSR